MAFRDKEQSAERKLGKMTVKIIDEENGLSVINNVRAVRIRDDEYVLLIMEDYSATLGEVNGTIAFVTNSDEVKLGDVKGFYRLRNNEFTLILR